MDDIDKGTVVPKKQIEANPISIFALALLSVSRDNNNKGTITFYNINSKFIFRMSDINRENNTVLTWIYHSTSEAKTVSGPIRANRLTIFSTQSVYVTFEPYISSNGIRAAGVNNGLSHRFAHEKA